MADPTSSPLDGADLDEGAAADQPRHPGDEAEGEGQGPVVRDRRRLDPQTGRVRQAYAETSGPQPPTTEETPVSDAVSGTADSANVAAAQQLAQERLEDLQRLNAEYVNYRKRVDRDREAVREVAVSTVLEALLPVLDDVHLARQHGDLESGPFSAIAEKLEGTLQRFGLERYGEVGEEFDPTVHEALMHTTAELAEGTTTTTVVQVLQPGYRVKDRVLRAARVAVADPT